MYVCEPDGCLVTKKVGYPRTGVTDSENQNVGTRNQTRSSPKATMLLDVEPHLQPPHTVFKCSVTKERSLSVYRCYSPRLEPYPQLDFTITLGKSNLYAVRQKEKDFGKEKSVSVLALPLFTARS